MVALNGMLVAVTSAVKAARCFAAMLGTVVLRLAAFPEYSFRDGVT